MTARIHTCLMLVTLVLKVAKLNGEITYTNIIEEREYDSYYEAI